MSDDKKDALVPVFVPPLFSLLGEMEQEKGQPLTRDEVEEVRDKATVMVVPKSRAEQLEKSRGRDIDPRNCWQEWQERRGRSAT